MLFDRYIVVFAELGTLQYELARTSDPKSAQVLLVEVREKLKELDHEAQRLLSQLDSRTGLSAPAD